MKQLTLANTLQGSPAEYGEEFGLNCMGEIEWMFPKTSNLRQNYDKPLTEKQNSEKTPSRK